MKRWIDLFMGAAIVAVGAGAPQHKAVLAQDTPPVAAQGARAEFEFARMIEVAQEARDYVQRRKDLLGGLPSDVQPLVTEGQQRLQELRQAIQQRDLRRARRIFRQALGLFDEIRFRLNEAMDAQDGATNTPEQKAAKLELAVTGLRSRLTELKRLAARDPLPAIDAELARIDGLIQALENRQPTATPSALRQQILDARRAIQAVEVAILDRMEVAP